MLSAADQAREQPDHAAHLLSDYPLLRYRQRPLLRDVDVLSARRHHLLPAVELLPIRRHNLLHADPVHARQPDHRLLPESVDRR